MALVLFVGIVLLTGGEERPPRPDEWLGGFLVVYAAVTGIRVAVWAFRTGALVAWWPELAIIAGACTIAWVLGPRYREEERALVARLLALRRARGKG